MTRAGPTHFGALALLLALVSAPAWAQSEAPPVPPDPSERPAERPSDRASEAPGFDDEDDDPPPRSRRGRGRALEDDDDPPLTEALVRPAEPGRNERLIRDINATRGEVSLAELVDEVLADVVAELALFPESRIGPMAIRQVALGANVKPAYAAKLRAAIISAVHTGTRIRMRRCLACEATRTRIEDGQWIVTRGIVDAQELRTIGRRLGVRTFLDVSFGFDPESGVVEMHFELLRAKDALVLWAETFRADESTPILLRSSDAPMRREKRLEDLKLLLEGRPYFGYMVSAGFTLVPYEDPFQGDIGGASVGFRVYERFGTDRRVMFGVDAQGFLNTERLAGAFLTAGVWWIPIEPNFIIPELRLGAKAGAFIAGSEGNTAAFQLGTEFLLRYRFGVYVYALFMTNSDFDGGTIGGVGVSTGLSFNW